MSLNDSLNSYLSSVLERKKRTEKNLSTWQSTTTKKKMPCHKTKHNDDDANSSEKYDNPKREKEGEREKI